MTGGVLHDAGSAIESGKQSMYPGVHAGSAPVGGRRQVGRGEKLSCHSVPGTGCRTPQGATELSHVGQ